MFNKDNALEMGWRIRVARQERGASQTELASRLDVSQSSVANWEVGRRGIPLEKVVPLCRFLRITPSYLFGAEPIDAAQLVTKEYNRFRDQIESKIEEIKRLQEFVDKMKPYYTEAVNPGCTWTLGDIKCVRSMDHEGSHWDGQERTWR